jgi:hypothetical protein
VAPLTTGVVNRVGGGREYRRAPTRAPRGWSPYIFGGRPWDSPPAHRFRVGRTKIIFVRHLYCDTARGRARVVVGVRSGRLPAQTVQCGHMQLGSHSSTKTYHFWNPKCELPLGACALELRSTRATGPVAGDGATWAHGSRRASARLAVDTTRGVHGTRARATRVRRRGESTATRRASRRAVHAKTCEV